jgi:RHS repeat-associated protein
MMPAAKMMDPVMGVDIHIIQPPGPVPPIPVPHPFIGMLMDPMDFVPIVGATIMVNGMPRAIAGTAGKALPPHIPIGGMFVKPPANECEMFMGSATVVLDGDPASYMALPALSCQDIGMPAPPRPNPKKKTKMKSLVLPTSVVLPIPAGLPVLIGGPPTISMMAMGMKAGMAGLGKLLKKPAKLLKRKLKKLKKAAARKMKPGFIKCKVLRAEPVHIITGEVMVEQRDFALGWRVPLDWTRNYGSQRQRVGLLGRGWETPADARLELDADGSVTFHDGTPGAAVFPSWPVNGPVTELVAGAVLDRSDDGAGVVVRVKGGLRWYFRAPVAGEREVPVAHVADGCDYWLQYVRDEHGTLTEIRDSSGRSVAVRLQGGLLAGLALADPDTGRLLPLVRYEYDNRGDLSAVYDALNVPYRFGYDWQRRLERHTDRVGLSFYYEYDAPTRDARCVHAWGDGGLYDYRFEYLPAVGQVRVTDSLGHTSVVEYDENELPVREVDPLGGVTTWEYDDAGRCAAEVDSAGRRTAWEYDDRGNLVKVTRPDATEVSAEYGDTGLTTAIIDPGGGRWEQVWDEHGLLRARSGPGGAIWSFDYDDRGGLRAVVDPLGNATSFQSDPFGRLRGMTDPAGGTTSVELDALGNAVVRVDPAGNRTSYRYDPKGRLVEVVNAAGGVVQCRYDAADRLEWVRDELGHVTEQRHVGIGEVGGRINADGTRVRYAYDTEERLIGVENERGQVYRIDRDALGRAIRHVDYWGNERTQLYAGSGPLAATIDATGRLTSYDFDAMGRLVGARYADGSSDVFDFDACGRVVRAENGSGIVGRSYDAEGRVVREEHDGFAIESEYDAVGRRVARRSANGHELRFAYDERGGVVGIDLDGGELARIERDVRGVAVRERLSGALERSFAWDSLGQMVGQRLQRGGGTIVGRTFTYDDAGNLVRRSDDRAGTVAYGYDPMGRVLETLDPAGRIAHLLYDPAGSLLHEPSGGEHAGTADGRAGGRVARRDGTEYHFDAAGNLSRRLSSAGEASFDWDGANRLVGVRTERGEMVRYAYDAFGRRTWKEVDGRRTTFRWDGDRLLADESEPGHPREFVYRPGSFEVLASVNGTIRHYENDQIGLPRELVGTDGAIVWSADYDALGAVESVRGDPDENPIRLQGQYFDAETGLYYNRYRYYDPGSCTFVSQDPLGLAAGVDLYRYAPNVWTWVDPFGLTCDAAKARIRKIPDGPGIYHIEAGGQHYTGSGVDVRQRLLNNTHPASGLMDDANVSITVRPVDLGTASTPRQQSHVLRSFEQATMDDLGNVPQQGGSLNMIRAARETRVDEFAAEASQHGASRGSPVSY